MTKYKSQWYQDKYLIEVVFRNLYNGTFVDIGAHDGIDGSNTFYMEKSLDWKGICVEANPKVYEKLKDNRSCTTINCAASSTSGEVEFTVLEGYSEMLSGITKNYHPSHLERIEKEIEVKGGNKKEIKIPSRRVDEILKEHDIWAIQYMSIDVEGSEMDVLRSIDFDNELLNIDVISVERNYPEQAKEIIPFMESKDYDGVAVLGGDFLFIHKNSEFRHNMNLP